MSAGKSKSVTNGHESRACSVLPLNLGQKLPIS